MVAPDPRALAVTAADLAADPARYHGQRVRFRGVVRNQLEGMSIGDAWWIPVGSLPEPGTHLADVVGTWRCAPPRDGGGRYGHLGRWPAEIEARVTPVPSSPARPFPGDRIADAPELEWLESRGVVDCMMQGMFWSRLPMTRAPRGVFRGEGPSHGREVRAVYFRSKGRLYVSELEALGAPRALTPRRITPESLRDLRSGELVEVEAVLASGSPYAFPRQPGAPEYVNWPRLEGVFDVVLPGVTDRYTVPSTQTPGVAEWLARLANGPRRVRVVGEVWHERLWATALELL